MCGRVKEALLFLRAALWRECGHAGSAAVSLKVGRYVDNVRDGRGMGPLF